MKIINRIYNYIIKKQPKITLGRWNIDYNIKQINKKVDLSNEDHCGPCGNYIIKKKYEDILLKDKNNNSPLSK
jgi:hypothetical protein